MAVFTPINKKGISLLLSQYHIGDVVTINGIASGIENSNFYLNTTTGQYVLTIFERLTATELPFYLQFTQHLSEQNLPVATIHPCRDRSLFTSMLGKPSVIAKRLKGHSITTANVDHCRALGSTLARMHLAAESFSQNKMNSRSLYWWQKVITTIVQNLKIDHTLASIEKKKLIKLIRDELSIQTDFFSSQEYANLPGHVCHCDLFRDNVFFEEIPNQLPTISGVFDFYFAGYDKRLFDLAVCVNDWCSQDNGHINLDLSKALCQAYSKICPVNAVENNVWSFMLRAAAFRFLMSRLYDYYLPRPATQLIAHDPKRFQFILQNHIDSNRSAHLFF